MLPIYGAIVYRTNIYTPMYTDSGWTQSVTRHHNSEQLVYSLENDLSVPRLDYVSPTIMSCAIYVMLDISFDATTLE